MRKSSSELVDEHLGLVVAATALGFIALRILAMAGYDPLTAKAIVQANSNATDALSVVLGTTPMLASLAFGLVVMLLTREVRESGRIPGHWWMYTIGVGLVFALTVPWSYFFAAVAVLLVALISYRRSKRRTALTGTRSASEERYFRAIGVSAIMVLVLATASTATLPSEAIQPAGEVAFPGSVLGRSQEDLIVLVDDAPPKVETFAAATTTHEICVRSDPAWWGQTLLQATQGAPYPTCPKIAG